jgi:hypothetical protein
MRGTFRTNTGNVKRGAYVQLFLLEEDEPKREVKDPRRRLLNKGVSTVAVIWHRINLED